MSAADQLLLWHGRTRPGLLDEPLRTRAAVLLGACLADRATAAGLDGAAVAEVRLTDAAGVLERYVASALESCRTVPGSVGEDVVDELLNAYGQPLFEEARQTVRETLAHHMADSGPHVRIVDRRQALLDNRGLQSS
ncbi:hypothetical protein OH809_38775 [Streptomyces sp. NBC_00873]|uniref:hypothetical protein n=1 Tax=unclassified Streptomyces TaxID=2593676 RepID=UPI00386D953C|nr:hypothetical protein OH809_38775 [Streptomyces sp. NBC_00873]WTA42059.1 hypothetical protein OH821_04930 [Streptomyces sp. NBC_00842]